VGLLDSHPIQYHAPWFRGLAQHCDLQVYFAHRQSAADQAQAGYGVAFDWDLDLTAGYAHEFLHNRAAEPNVYRFGGCDTPEIRAKIRDGRFDAFVVTGWYLKSFWQAARAAREHRTPILVRGDSQLGTPRAAWKRLAKQVGYRLMLRQFDAYLAVGRRNAEYLRHYGARGERIYAAPHFVDAAWFRARVPVSPAELAAARATLGAPEHHRALLFVGRLVDFKRPLDVVRAAAGLRAQGTGAALHVAFAGSGALSGAIERLAAELGVSIKLLGFRNQSELPALYAAADVLVLPSDAHETWGLVVNEAMACGTPAVVSTAAGCAPDLIDAFTGRSYECGDLDGLRRALLDACELARSEDSRRALDRKTQEFSCERAVAGTLEAIRATVARLR
jgi:glycosyltransferase involved in cell wall biosynthesis